jgi:predicted oxidoreductase
MQRFLCHMTAMSYLPSSHESRPLGKSGFDVSPIAWGMWRFAGQDVKAAQALVEAAFAAGVTLFDTADIYGADEPAGFGGAEALLGQVFKAAPNLREKMVLASKGGISLGVPYDSSAAYLTSAIDASLTRLGVDRIDLWQIHRPDILTHPAEIAATLEAAHKAGKIGAIGVSNYTPAQTLALQSHLSLPIVSDQPEFSALALDSLSDGVMDAAMTHDRAILAWSPLGGGRLADPRDDRARAVVGLLDAKAGEYGVSRSAAAYSWIMAHPARPIPIVGTQNRERIADIPNAFTPRWTRADWYAVLVASQGHPLP